MGSLCICRLEECKEIKEAAKETAIRLSQKVSRTCSNFFPVFLFGPWLDGKMG